MESEELSTGAGRAGALATAGRTRASSEPVSKAKPARQPTRQRPLHAKRRHASQVRARDEQQLSTTIKSRIEDRTAGRVRDLDVVVRHQRIELRGHCATFYTKQLAQHAAMGVLEDEVLVNLITVGV